MTSSAMKYRGALSSATRPDAPRSARGFAARSATQKNLMETQRYYQIVHELILDRLKSGELHPGDKLPSERSLCAETGVNRNTVRHALLLLQREGKIFRLDRKGWYVNPTRLVYDPANHVNFARLAASQNRNARWTTEDNSSFVVDHVLDTPGAQGFPQGTEVYEMENIFFLDQQKVACVLTYLHAGVLPGIVPKTRDCAMTQVIEQEYGISLLQRDLLIRPEFLSRKISASLGLPPGSPGVYIRRVKTDARDRVLTVEHEYWRFDAMELRVSQR